jgi:hypothetical protein
MGGQLDWGPPRANWPIARGPMAGAGPFAVAGPIGRGAPPEKKNKKFKFF